MFTPQQIKQFKEAFTMIDQDGDGRVTESDLGEMFSNLGTYFSLRVGVVLKLISTMLAVRTNAHTRAPPFPSYVPLRTVRYSTEQASEPF